MSDEKLEKLNLRITRLENYVADVKSEMVCLLKIFRESTYAEDMRKSVNSLYKIMNDLCILDNEMCRLPEDKTDNMYTKVREELDVK